MANSAARVRERMQSRVFRMDSLGTGYWFHPEVEEHGESAYKNWGCRCLVCTEANTAATDRTRARLQRSKRKVRHEQRVTFLASKREKFFQALPPAVVVGIQRRPNSK